MAFLPATSTMCIPAMAVVVAPPRRSSLMVARATAKPSQQQLAEPAANNGGDGDSFCGRRRGMAVFATAAMVAAAASAAVIIQPASAVGECDVIRNLRAPDVVDVGNWAVNKHNQESRDNLQFSEVVGGCKQIVAGTKYKLDIKMKDTSQLYAAEVLEPVPAGSERQLTFFQGLLR